MPEVSSKNKMANCKIFEVFADLPQTVKILTAKFCDRRALCFVIVEPRKIFHEIFASGQSAKIWSRENFSPYGNSGSNEIQKSALKSRNTLEIQNTTVEFGNTPFIVGDSQHLQCQYGPQYYKSKPKTIMFAKHT